MARYEYGAEVDWRFHPFDWSRRLICSIDSTVDVAELKAKFEEDGYEQLWLRISRSARVEDLDFLDQVAGIKELNVLGPVKNDDHAFRVSGLRALTLVTRSRRPIPDVLLDGLTKLGLDDRPGLEQVGRAPNLAAFGLYRWSGTSFAFLGAKDRLRTVQIEGKRQLIALDGLDAAPALEELELLDLRAASLAPLAACHSLRRVWLIGRPSMTQECTLDLADLERLEGLSEVRINHAGRVRSLKPLLNIASLTDVRFGDTDVLDHDYRPLDELAQRATVVGPDD